MVLLYFPIPRCIKLCQLFGYVPGTRKLMNPDITNDRQRSYYLHKYLQ